MLKLNEPSGIAIVAQNLNYRFGDDQKYVLKNLNFEIKGGEKVCIFGTEGSGKTSLLKMFTGAYLDYEGSLLYNNYPLSNLDLKELRNEIGIYLGYADLFSGTLQENLTLGDKAISIPAILKTSEETGLLPFILNLKDGLDTTVESLGKNFPRNTVNKILITRALLTEPKLMLIEDCWSGLERNEQEKMITYLTNSNHRFTLLAVTNDDSFASKCDRVILLQNGEITLQGTYAEVSNTTIYRSIFKQLSL